MARKPSRKDPGASVKYLKFLIIGIFFIFALLFIYRYSIGLLKHARMFTIKEVALDPSLQSIQSRVLERLEGQSLFDVDIQALQRRLQEQYPEIDRLRIIRQFPNRLYIAAKKRDSFAVVGLDNRDVLIDKNGVVLSLNVPAEAKWPVIRPGRTGKKAVVGETLNLQQVDVGLALIKAVAADENLMNHRVVSVDIQNFSKIEMLLSINLKVIIDSDKIDYKIKRLGILLSQGNLDLKEVGYVDVRFKEPILGKK